MPTSMVMVRCQKHGNLSKLLAVACRYRVEPLDGSEHGILRSDDTEVSLRVERLACFGADLLASLE